MLKSLKLFLYTINVNSRESHNVMTIFQSPPRGVVLQYKTFLRTRSYKPILDTNVRNDIFKVTLVVINSSHEVRAGYTVHGTSTYGVLQDIKE